MSDRPEPRARSFAGVAAVVLVVLFLLLPLLYVLSMGPAVWLARHSYLDATPNSPAVKFYGPVLWLEDHNSPAWEVIEQYMELWDQ